MKISFKIFCYRFVFHILKERKTIGINSLLPNGQHILLLDYDNVELEMVKSEIQNLQKKYKLPKAYIVPIGNNNSYHVYIFKALNFEDVCRIMGSTEYACKTHQALGFLRGYWTLRIKGYKGKEFGPAIILSSEFPEDVDPFELQYLSTYYTAKR